MSNFYDVMAFFGDRIMGMTGTPIFKDLSFFGEEFGIRPGNNLREMGFNEL